MQAVETLEAEIRELRSIVRSLSEATQRALSLIEIAHHRDLAQDPGYQDLISEATGYASRARRLLGDEARQQGNERPRQMRTSHKYL
jgi:hypothetical protein